MTVTPQTGNDKLRIAHVGYILDAFIKNGRVMYLKGCDKSFIGIVLFFDFQVFLMNQEFTDQQYSKNHTDNSHRISNRTS